jgi:biopolymer transport protein TolR
MGGGAMPEQGGGGKRKRRSLDAVINVVPAIDLLSCCISFLLFTAVWTQISRLQASQFGQAAPSEQQQVQKSLFVTLSLTERGYLLGTSAGAALEIPALGRDAQGGLRYDLRGLEAKLKQLKSEFPDQAAITVAADDGVVYADLIHAIDACVGAGLPNVSVTGTG